MIEAIIVTVMMLVMSIAFNPEDLDTGCSGLPDEKGFDFFDCMNQDVDMGRKDMGSKDMGDDSD